MPPKVKPRWGWEPQYGGSVLKAKMETLDLQWLVDQFGDHPLSVPLTVKQEISHALWLFCEAQFEDPAPDFEEIGAALEVISSEAISLREKLEALDHRSRSALGYALSNITPSENNGLTSSEISDGNALLRPPVDQSSNFSLITTLKVLEIALSELEVPSVTKKRGPKPKNAIKDLIYKLSEVLRESRRMDPLDDFYYDPIKGQYEGRLVRIMDHILGRFEVAPPMTNNGIGDQIRRTIGNRSK